MGISFNQIPSALRTPFVAVEFDSSQAQQGAALLAYRAIIIGQKTSAGTATADTLYKVTSVAQVITLAGRGSMLHRMAIAWFASNKFTELWIGVLADNGAGVAATGTITVTGTATATGTIPLYLGGELISVPVTSGDVQNTIAAAINTAINANLDIPVTSTVSTNVVTVAFRHKGTVGNSYNMRAVYADGEAIPAGVTLAFVQLASGTTDPTLTNLIAAMGDMWFQILAHPYTGSTPLAAIEAELLSRAGPMRMIDGLAVTSAQGNLSTLTTLGVARNSQYSEIAAQPGSTPLTPPMEHAAEVAVLLAYYGQIDPARPFQTLAMTHTLAPPDTARFTQTERNTMLFDGIATTRVGPGNVVQLDRMITTYQLNSAGAPDTAYLDATTVLTLLYLRYSFRVQFQTRYPRHKLADDGTRFGPGQAIMTPKLGKAEAFSWFRSMEEAGLLEDFDQFKRDLVVARNDTDRNRLDFLLPPNLINQLIVTAARMAFRL